MAPKALLLLALSVAAATVTGSVFGQRLFSDSPAAGQLLVASDKLDDPHFSRTVVLLLDYNADRGALGLILNRQTDLPLSRLFPNLRDIRNDPAFEGGPVDRRVIQALVQLPGKQEEAQHIVGDVYATGNRDLIEKSLSAHLDASKLRLYLGYAGWGPGQLENELTAGAWTLVPATDRICFDPDVESLWTRLNRQANSKWAMLKPPPF